MLLHLTEELIRHWILMTQIFMKTNQLRLGVVLTQKIQNNYLIPFVTSFFENVNKKHFP